MGRARVSGGIAAPPLLSEAEKTCLIYNAWPHTDVVDLISAAPPLTEHYLLICHTSAF